jgi:hypothetical protein
VVGHLSLRQHEPCVVAEAVWLQGWMLKGLISGSVERISDSSLRDSQGSRAHIAMGYIIHLV